MVDKETRFQGGVFSEAIEGGRAGASVSLNLSEIIAETNAGDRFAIRFRDCQLEMGGASGKMIFCRTPDRSLTIFCEAPGFANALSENSSGLFTEQLRNLVRTRRQQDNSFRFWLLAGTIVCLIALVAGYFGVIVAARAAIASLPVSVDEKIGNIAFKSIDLSERLDAGHSASQLVTNIVKKLEPHAALRGLQFKVTVVDEETVNAFALPGGQIVVYTGLIKKAESPEQLAGVLAHEMSHATLRHGLKGVGHSLGIVAAVQVLVGDVGGLLALVSHVAQESILTSYSRQAETEADLEGARMLHAAGINPLVMAEFFNILENEEGNMPGVLAWISTHPQHADRVATIQKFEQTLPKKAYRALELPWKEVQIQLR